MADMRSCIKTGCRWPAAATLSYRYTTAEVWLSDLGDHHPATHDLCPHHADALRVPRGWTLVDDRQPAVVVHEPSAAEIVERVTTLRRSVDAMLELQRDAAHEPPSRRSRYEALLGSLPTYDPAADPEDAGAQDARDEAAPPPVAVPPAVLVPVGVSHEMAPIVRELARAHPAAPARGPATRESARPGADAVHETGLRGAIVLTLPLRTDDDPDDGPGAGPGDRPGDRPGDGEAG